MKFTSTSTITIFILLSTTISSAFSDNIERKPIPSDEQQGSRRVLAQEHEFRTPTMRMREEGEESNENVAPELMGAVQVAFANCDTKTQCTKYGQNSCETIYQDCNKQCVWNSSQNICAYNNPQPRSPTKKPTRKPTKQPSPTPGSSICTYPPNYSCYQTGKPECCGDDNGSNCPSYPTMCDNYPEDYTGWNYCTYQPNYGCYPGSGHPSCCSMSGGGTMNCPIDKPPCEGGRFLRSQRRSGDEGN